MSDDLKKQIFQAIDGTISDQEFEDLQKSILQDKSTGKAYLEAVSLSESLMVAAADADSEEQKVQANPTIQRVTRPQRFHSLQYAIALVLLIGVGICSFWVGSWQAIDDQVTQIPSNRVEQEETRIAGHAILRRVVDLDWGLGNQRHHEGDVLADGVFEFDRGLVEIDFLCGASLIVEGSAKLDIESDWVVQLAKGRLRANVPPAARGFVVKAVDSEIIDLGTEFVQRMRESR